MNEEQVFHMQGVLDGWVARCLVWFTALFCAAIPGCGPDVPTPMDMTSQHVLENARTINGGLLPSIITGSSVQAYVNAVGSRLYDAAVSSSRGKDAIQSMIQVDLLNSSNALAFTIGGEHIYLSTGTLQLCSTEEDLAAVLSHEYAHILDKHQQKHDQVDSTDVIAVADLLSHSPPTEDEEKEADQDGYTLFARGGWDPARYADAWEKLSGVDGRYRAAAIRHYVSNLPPASDDWRKPPVADRYSFHRIVRSATAVPDRSDEMSRLLMRCMKSCIGTDNVIDRAAAVARLDSLIPSSVGGGGRTEIGPRAPGPGQ